MAFPFRFQRGHVHDNAATGIGAFSKAHGQHTAGNTEVLNRAGQRKRIGRNNANISDKIHKGFFIEGLGVHDGRIDVGEDLEFIGTTHIVAIAAGAIADNTLPILVAHLAWLEGLDHALGSNPPNPTVAFDTHKKLAALNQ